MSTVTENYNFIKPELTDAADITNTNANWDKLDDTLANDVVLADGSVPMTSDLHIDKDEYTQLFLGETSTNSQARLQLHDGGLMIDAIPNADDKNNSRYVMLYGDGTLTDTLRLVDMVNGVKKWYKLYGEHNKPTAQDVGALTSATGSYVGNGGYGAEYPNSLTFDFEPKMLIIQEDATNGATPTIMIRGTSHYYQSGSVTWSGNTVTWWSSTAVRQKNDSGWKYSYLAIG